MRPRRVYHPEAAVAAAVRELRDRFDYPDERQQGITAAGDGGGGAPSIVIAASDASDFSKSKADLICSGTSDSDVIQFAFAELAGVFGTVWLTEGTFWCDPNVLATGGGIKLRGLNQEQTILRTTSPTGTIITLGNNSSISDLRIWGLSTEVAIDMLGSRCHVDNVLFQSVDRCILPNALATITRCGHTGGVGVFVDDETRTSQSVIVAFNTEVSHIQCGQSINWIVAHNVCVGEIVADGAEVLAVVENTWVSPSPFDGSHIMEFENVRGLLVANNQMANRGFARALRLVGCVDFKIADNAFDDIEFGISVEQSSHGNIDDNNVGGQEYLGADGIVLTDCEDVHVNGGRVFYPAGLDLDNTYDAVRVEGTSPDCSVKGVKVVAPPSGNKPRFAVNIAGPGVTCARVVGNDYGLVAGYGTDAYQDLGTNTLAFWPNDPVYGDNFTDCEAAS